MRYFRLKIWWGGDNNVVKVIEKLFYHKCNFVIRGQRPDVLCGHSQVAGASGVSQPCPISPWVEAVHYTEQGSCHSVEQG